MVRSGSTLQAQKCTISISLPFRQVRLHGQCRPAGQNVWMSVGIIATSGACTFGDPHVHLSGDFSSSSYLVSVNRTNETCWSNTTSRCSSSTYTRRHTADSLCPPSTPEYFTSTISGNVSTYICETWSVKTHPQSARQMRIRW